MPTVDSPAILINGQAGTDVPALDRGLQFGDGLFETIAVRRGRPLLVNEHLDRLRAGAARLGIDIVTSRDILGREIDAVAGDSERGIVKLTVTRGTGGRGYSPPEPASPTRVVSAHPWPADVLTNQGSGIAVGVSPVRLGRQPLLAGIKHLNRLEQVLARSHWRDGWQEALMLDDTGRVIEASAANLFVVRDDCIQTPPLDECGVAGLIRQKLLEGAVSADRRPVIERAVDVADLHEAREVFLTNCVIGLWPVTRIEDNRYAIGPVSRVLQVQLNEKNLAIFD